MKQAFDVAVVGGGLAGLSAAAYLGRAGLSVVVVTLLTRPLVGALWGLVLVIVGARHAYLWVARKRRES